MTVEDRKLYVKLFNKSLLDNEILFLLWLMKFSNRILIKIYNLKGIIPLLQRFSHVAQEWTNFIL